MVVAFHGSIGSPGAMRVATGYGFDRLADRHGFIVAYPQGHDGGHVVPPPAYRPRLLGRVTSAVDGPAAAWAFFRRQPPRRPPPPLR